MANTLIIIILLVALAVTAGLLIFVVIFFLRRRDTGQAGSGEFLARVLDGLPVPVLEIDSRHKVIQWNAALESLSGVRKSDVLGTDGQWRAFYPDKRPVMADLIADGASEEEIGAVYRGGARRSQLIEGAWEAENFFPSMGKEGRWYHFTASPIRDSGKIIGAVEILEDVTERHTAEENLRYYVGQVTRVQEDERRRVARELHDTTVQTLVVLIYRLDNFFAGKPKLTEDETARLKAFYGSLKGAVDEVRRFSRELRPPVLDDLGLGPVLEWLTGEMKKNYNFDVTIEAEGHEQRLAQETEIALFRIIQEALINAAKHSGVNSASVSIHYMPDKILVNIADNGSGFELPAKVSALPRDGKMGLVGMGERVQLLGGRLEMDTGTGRGTRVSVEIPLK